MGVGTGVHVEVGCGVCVGPGVNVDVGVGVMGAERVPDAGDASGDNGDSGDSEIRGDAQPTT